MDSCIFCGMANASLTVEHVIPQWARRCFDMHGPLTVYAGGRASVDRTTVGKLQHLNVTLDRAICRSCNTDYLGRLEGVVSPILKPMAYSAKPRVLSLSDQRLLAHWSVKTVLLLELAVRQHYPTSRPIQGYVATPQELAWLWAHREPPPRSLVWIGCWDCEQSSPVMYEPSGAPLPTADGCEVVGHMSTFSLGYVAFQVFTVDFVAAESHGAVPWNSRPPSSLADALKRIWPTGNSELSWPPHAFSGIDWNRLVTWDGALRPQTVA